MSFPARFAFESATRSVGATANVHLLLVSATRLHQMLPSVMVPRALNIRKRFELKSSLFPRILGRKLALTHALHLDRVNHFPIVQTLERNTVVGANPSINGFFYGGFRDQATNNSRMIV